MTKKALNKLNDKQMNYCTILSVLIANDREKGLKEQYPKDSGKLWGYLQCMEDMKVISNSEMKALYLWFLANRRDKNFTL